MANNIGTAVGPQDDVSRRMAQVSGLDQILLVLLFFCSPTIYGILSQLFHPSVKKTL